MMRSRLKWSLWTLVLVSLPVLMVVAQEAPEGDSEAGSPSDQAALVAEDDTPPSVEQELPDETTAVAMAQPTAEPRRVSRQGLIASLTIFVMAIFVGFEVITKVPPTLHTPLMSGSNAISGITLVGAVIVASVTTGWFSPILGFVAVALATVNVVGGFLVTHRMLAMFKRK